MIKFSYDPEVDALYIRLKETTVTTGRIEEGVALDYDSADRLAGIEILDAMKRLDSREASKRFASAASPTDEHVRLRHSIPLNLSAIQMQVLDSLRRVETEEYRLGGWYLGALYALENRNNPDRISQAAQSLRELMEKLPRVVRASDVHTYRPNIPELRREIFRRLEDDKVRYGDDWKDKVIDVQLDKTLRKIDGYMESSQLPTRKDQIQIALRNIDPMADYIEIDIQKQKRDAFHRLWFQLEGFAHHRSRRHQDEQKFREYVSILERLIYDLLSPITAQDQQQIKSILDKSQHSAADAETLYKLISRRGANYVYFFTNATEPDWIPFLKAKGFFRNPPSAQYSSDGFVQLPFWPELEYLKKVCEDAPDATVQLALDLPAVDNPRVYQDILDIALHLDGTRSAQLKAKILEYVGLEHRIFPLKFPELLAHWTADGQTPAALELANVLVQFVPDPKTEEKKKKYTEIDKNQSNGDEDPVTLMMTTILEPVPRFSSIYVDVLNEGRSSARGKRTVQGCSNVNLCDSHYDQSRQAPGRPCQWYEHGFFGNMVPAANQAETGLPGFTRIPRAYADLRLRKCVETIERSNRRPGHRLKEPKVGCFQAYQTTSVWGTPKPIHPSVD